MEEIKPVAWLIEYENGEREVSFGSGAWSAVLSSKATPLDARIESESDLHAAAHRLGLVIGSLHKREGA